MLTSLSNRYSTEYESPERAANLFITFIFVIFFFQFFRNFILEKPVDKYMILVQIILIMIWYGFTLMIV
jgi:hypothetical protein